MANIRYQVLKTGVPIAVCDNWVEASDWALKYDADEIREIEDESIEEDDNS